MSRTRHIGKARAFTLIELLVVTAIIAGLTAVLMPALQTARLQAGATRCAAHIRQLGTGMTFYMHQYGAFPAHQWILKPASGELRIRWFNAMARMLGGYRVQGCPSVPHWEVDRNNSYGYNYKYLGSARDNAVSPTAPFERFPVRFVRAPVRTIAFGDSDGTGWLREHVPGVKDPEMLGNHGYTLDPTYIPLFSDQTHSDGVLEPWAWKQRRTYISTRHRGRSNLCFADGHAESMEPRQVYEDNRYWNGLGGEDIRRDAHRTGPGAKYGDPGPGGRPRFPFMEE